MFSSSSNEKLKKIEEAKAEAKKEEEYEIFLNGLFEEIYKKYGFYRFSTSKL
jgi:hypothetical protein